MNIKWRIIIDTQRIFFPQGGKYKKLLPTRRKIQNLVDFLSAI